MKVKFIYKVPFKDESKEKVIYRVCDIISKHISLPEQIEIMFMTLGPSCYGQTVLDPRYKNRVVLNIDLEHRDLIVPTVHELIHLNQIHTKRLGVRRDGKYLWDGQVYAVESPDKMLYKNYKNLPWEQDVAKKQQKLLENLFINQ
jgi:hypothetical protein